MTTKFKQKRAIVIANGILPSVSRLRQWAECVDFIICADGAADRLHQGASHILPAFIVGDFDSISPLAKAFYHGKSILEHRMDQNSTDLEKALLLALEQGVSEVWVTGVNGGRFDHILTNLHVLDKFLSQVSISLFDEDGYGHFLNFSLGYSKLHLSEPPGTTVSLIPLGVVKSISTSGLEYPLCGEVLEWAGRSGQSNRIVHQPCSISLGEAFDSDSSSRTASMLVYILPHEVHVPQRLLES